MHTYVDVDMNCRQRKILHIQQLSRRKMICCVCVGGGGGGGVGPPPRCVVATSVKIVLFT